MQKPIATFTLKDGREAEINFLSKKDSTRELNRFINALVEEEAPVIYGSRVSLKEEERWKKNELEGLRKGERFLLLARVGGKLAGTSGARRGIGKSKENVSLGIALAKEFRGAGLGEKLLSIGIKLSEKFFRPRNIYLSVLACNKPAYSMYKKLGFREFARFPKWVIQRGEYVDQVFMKLEKQ
ncbi:MAG: GNAT family N-acetyltransferase [Candidatus Bilamarchaeaceae archaeon]